MQGRWEATGHGLLTVSGCYVQYDKYNTAGKGRRLILSYSPDGFVALGDWRTRVGIGATGMPPKELIWKCAGANNEEAISWRRLPASLQQRGVARSGMRATSKVAEQHQLPVAVPQVREECEDEAPLKAAKVAGRARARTKTPAHQDNSHVAAALPPAQPSREFTLPSSQELEEMMEEEEDEEVAAVVSSDAGSEGVDEDPGVRWLVQRDEDPVSCAACCAPLRPATEAECMSVACDACHGQLRNGEQMLVCSSRDECETGCDVCFYAVCPPCRSKPHSERPAHKWPPRLALRGGSKRRLDGKIVYPVWSSVW